MKLRAAAVWAWVLLATAARAQSPATAAEARQHFETGLAEVARGDVTSALREFELAYQSRPHFSVLYNIGQAYSALGKPVEAIAAFERYVAEAGTQIGEERRQAVEALLDKNRGRVGRIRFTSAPGARTEVWLDGAQVLPERWGEPLTLASGEHSVLFTSQGCTPVVRKLVVTASEELEVALPKASECRSEVGQLQVDCELPGVSVEVGGVTLATTPLAAPLLVPVGQKTVRFVRLGYAMPSRELRIVANELSKAACDQRVMTPLPLALSGSLKVRASPADAAVLVDGRPQAGPWLPVGLHQVEVKRTGFRPRRWQVWLGSSKPVAYDVTLAPTLERQREVTSQATQQRRAAFVLGGVGLAFLGGATGLYAWNNGRYDDWGSPGSTASIKERLNQVSSVQRVDDLAMGLAILGTGGVVSAAWLLLTAPRHP